MFLRGSGDRRDLAQVKIPKNLFDALGHASALARACRLLSARMTCGAGPA